MGNRKYTTEFKLDAVRLALSSESSQAQVCWLRGFLRNVLSFKGDFNLTVSNRVCMLMAVACLKL